MRRLLLLRYTGPEAKSLGVARRVARKIRGTVRAGQCVLVDCESVQLSGPILRVLAAESNVEKVRFCGLSTADQATLKHQDTTKEQSETA